MKKGFTNEYELRFIGMQRSGHHPILNWLSAHFKGKICFLNFVDIDKNPFTSFKERGTLKFNKKFHKDFNVEKEASGKLTKKKALIYNHEDEFIENIENSVFEKNREKWLGKSEKKFNILIVRDPYNLFASRLKHNNIFENKKEKFTGYLGAKEKAKTVKLWKGYAKELLELTHYLKGETILINYNLWFTSKDYRKSIAQKMGLKFTDKKFKEVPGQGGGSSFSGMKYEPGFLERWKHYENTPYFKYFLDDPELRALSKKIFGEIPGTEKIHSLTEEEKIKLGMQKRIVRNHNTRIKIDRKIGELGLLIKKFHPKAYNLLKNLAPKLR